MNPTEPFLPDHIRDGVTNYIEKGVPPGDFLRAVICNNLCEAIGRADHINIAHITNIVSWFYNEAPGTCWGSPEKYETWLKEFEGAE